MKLFKILCLLLFYVASFSDTIYDLKEEYRTFEIKNNISFSLIYQDTNIFLENPFGLVLKNFTIDKKTRKNIPNICKADDLSLSLTEIAPNITIHEKLFHNPEFFYKKPYLYYIDDLMNTINYKKLLFNDDKLFFEEQETRSFEKISIEIPKNSFFQFFYEKKKSMIIVYINNKIYKIDIKDTEPKLLKEVIEIPDININEINDLLIIDSCFLFLKQNQTILLYCPTNSNETEINLLQTIDKVSLKLKDDLNVTSIYFDETTDTFIFSDYLNGIYHYNFTKEHVLLMENRLNFGKVLQLDLQGASLILIKEISRRNFTSIALQEYLFINKEFMINREIYLSSKPKFKSVIRTLDFLAIMEPNLIHLYRPFLNNQLIKLKEKEIYQDFNVDNILEIKPFSLHNSYNESFFLGVYRDKIKIFHPHINPIYLNCTLPNDISLEENFQFSLYFNLQLEFLNCFEKNLVNDYNSENYCRKTIGMKIELSNSKKTFIQKLDSDKALQIIITTIIGACVGSLIGVMVCFLLKRKYKELKLNYDFLENQISQLDMMSHKGSGRDGERK